MAGLTDLVNGIGVVSYNGYVLTPARSYEFDISPVLDDAQRGKVYQRYALKGRWWVTSADEDTSSTSMTTLRQKLSEPGQKLTITDIGFGDITVGGDATTYDPAFGPFPRTGHCEPRGGMIAWLVDWSIEFNLLDCESLAQTAIGGLIALNRKVAISVDMKGYTTITQSGYWQVSMNRVNGGSTLSKNADDMRDRFKANVPSGFRREVSNFTPNEAGNRMDFSIVDVEMHGSDYPEGIVETHISYDVAANERTFSKWQATLAGTLEVKKGFPLGLAATKFLAIVAKKKAALQRAAAGSGSDAMVIVERFSFGMEDIFGRTSRFSITFLVVGQFADFIRQSGVWERVVDQGEGDRWRANMNLDVWTSRGLAKVKIPNDTIIDACQGEPLNIPALTAANYNNDYGSFEAPMFAVGNIPYEKSWLEYENHIRYVREQQTATHSPAVSVPAPKSTSTSMGIAAGFTTTFGPASGTSGAKLAPPQSLAAESNSTIQFQSAPNDMLVMYGKAMRVKFEPVVPTVGMVLGAEPVMVKAVVEPAWIIGRVGTDNAPVFVTRWAYLFKVPDNFKVEQAAKGAPNPAIPPAKGAV